MMQVMMLAVVPVLNAVADVAKPAQVEEPRRPTFISKRFKEVLRTEFENLPGRPTTKQIEGKVKENEELKTFWEQFVQENKSKAFAADAVKQFLGGTRTGVRGHLDPAMESKLWALLTPET